MAKEIKESIERCKACTRLSPSQCSEPLIHSKTDFPMDLLGIDLFYTNGKNYLCAVDRFSGFPFVKKLTSLNTRSILNILLTWFNEFGFPKAIRADGGPQFRGEFGEFCRRHGIERQLTSPYNPQANGLAESAVKQMKYLIQKVDHNENDFRQALLSWRNTPRADGVSPAQMMFGYSQNFGQGRFTNNFVDRISAHNSRAADDDLTKQKYDTHTQKLPQIKTGSRVAVQNQKTKRWDIYGNVSGMREDERSYNISCDDGSLVCRNRRFIKVADV